MMKAADGLRELIDAGPEAPIVAKLVEIVAEYDKALQTWLDSGWADEAASKALNRASQRIGMTAAITSRAQHDHRRTTPAAITAATDALAGSVGSTTASLPDRKGAVEGKSGTERVDFGGRRVTKKKTKKTT